MFEKIQKNPEYAEKFEFGLKESISFLPSISIEIELIHIHQNYFFDVALKRGLANNY